MIAEQGSRSRRWVQILGLVLSVLLVLVVVGVAVFSLGRFRQPATTESSNQPIAAVATTPIEAVQEGLRRAKTGQPTDGLQFAPDWWVQQQATSEETIIIGEVEKEKERARVQVLFTTPKTAEGLKDPEETYFFDLVQTDHQWKIDSIAYSVLPTLGGVWLGSIDVNDALLEARQQELDDGINSAFNDPLETLLAEAGDYGLSPEPDSATLLLESDTEVRFSVVDNGMRWLVIVSQPRVTGAGGAWMITGIFLIE